MSLAEKKASRNARKAATQEASDAQEEIDLEAIDALEEEHGDSRVKVVSVPYSTKDELPTMCAVKCPSATSMKRYRDSVKPNKKGVLGDSLAAAEALATVCLIYPDKEVHAKLRAARPGLHVQLGLAALQLASGEAEDEGKD